MDNYHRNICAYILSVIGTVVCFVLCCISIWEGKASCVTAILLFFDGVFFIRSVVGLISEIRSD